MGIVISVAGALASIIAAAIAIWQASKARSAAGEAEKIREQMIGQRETSELSQVQVNCRRAQNTMVKYGPAATNSRVYCTNRHGTVRIYGYPDGRVWIRQQRTTNKSCVYDGTHY